MVLRKDVGKHASDCVARLVECEGCRSSIKHTDREVHEAECFSRSTTCEFCSAEFSRSDLSSHNASCPDYVIPCTQAENGCPWKGPRSALSESHVPHCPYESIKGFFSLNSAKITAITDENTILKAKLEALEGLVQTMKREMASVKFALGPWYQPNEIHTPTPPAGAHGRPAPFRTHTRPTSFDLGTMSPPPASLMAYASSSGAMHPATPDALAAYFPPEANEPAASWPGQRRGSMSLLADAGARMYQDSTLQAAVAPLNLGTTLEGSLSGLRDSVVTLSAAVDSLARRTDMERRNEALRMNEEVSRLNYTVNGLRMQVHNVMMDRNAQIMGRVPEPWAEGENAPALPSGFFPRSPSFSTATKL
ncbi:hypothetical protein HWV62_29684 [Athelia sp. TMB]|nr:hypothetical protein HWV62_29684 [Athelia sp. TMB]